MDASDVLPTEHDEPKSAELLTLNSKLNEIKANAAAGASCEELFRLIKAVHADFPLVFPFLNPGLKLYRAVRVTAKPWKLNRLGRPPETVVLHTGRVNRPYQSVFYASFGGRSACLYECGAQVGDTFVISEWQITQHAGLIPFGFTNARVAALRRSMSKTPYWMGSMSQRPQDVLLQEWQSKIFTAQGSETAYALSNALALLAEEYARRNGATSKNSKFAGLIYPSVSCALLADNVALEASFADRALRFLRCDMVIVRRLSQVESMNYELSLSDVDVIDFCVTTSQDGRLHWMRESTSFLYSNWYATA